MEGEGGSIIDNTPLCTHCSCWDVARVTDMEAGMGGSGSSGCSGSSGSGGGYLL